MDKNIDIILNKLSKSKFRSSFHLRKYMIKYIKDKGMDTIREHTVSFVNQKLSIYNPNNDGKQTPMKNHPSFIAMHACACCCRGCIGKWHKIPKTRNLNDKEKEYIVNLLMAWIDKEYHMNL